MHHFTHACDNTLNFVSEKKIYNFTLSTFYFYPSNYKLHLRRVNKKGLHVTQTDLQAVLVTTEVIVLPKLYQWTFLCSLCTRGSERQGGVEAKGLGREEWLGENSPELIIPPWGLNLSSIRGHFFFFLACSLVQPCLCICPFHAFNPLGTAWGTKRHLKWREGKHWC